MFIRPINSFNNNQKYSLKNSAVDQYYVLKPAVIQNDTLSLGFKGLSLPKKNIEEYQNLVSEILKKFRKILNKELYLK